MLQTIGEKIKSLRKDLNMTQSELAGGEMTKSMLSQIENNVSNPSMKNLLYLASRLNKPVSYFLESDEQHHNSQAQNNDRFLLDEDHIKFISDLIDSQKTEEAKEEIEKLINDADVNKNQRIFPDLLLKLGNALVKDNRFGEGKAFINLSIDTYIEGTFYKEGAKAYVELARIFYQEFNYDECLLISEKAFELYYKDINKDPLFEIELYHYKILILSAIGDIRNAAKAIEVAIDLSAKTSVYYKTAELYRLRGVFNYLMGNENEFRKSIEKALQFAEFSEDKACLGKIHTVLAIVALECGDAGKALEEAELSINFLEKEIYIHYLIRAQAYYLLESYDLAYKNIVNVYFPDYETHKFDYLYLYSSKTYEGLILSKLGKHAEGIEAIKAGIEKMSTLGNSKFLAKAYKSLSEVYSNTKDFENAFIYLKRANDIQDFINKDDGILF